jgi:hypothetical protein
LLINLFGDTPDYSDPKFEELWQRAYALEDKEMIAFCLEKGVDVLDTDAEPVSGWRDIVVMLKALECGFLKRSGRKAALTGKKQGLRHDPVEDTAQYLAILPELEAKLAGKMKAYRRRRGIRSPYYDLKKEILQQDYGLEWKSPRELNPGVKFD